jgi:hypothetical protein
MAELQPTHRPARTTWRTGHFTPTSPEDAARPPTLDGCRVTMAELGYQFIRTLAGTDIFGKPSGEVVVISVASGWCYQHHATGGSRSPSKPLANLSELVAWLTT